jgi:hypothetical protein
MSAGAVGLPAEAFGTVLRTLTGGEVTGGDILGFLPDELAEAGKRFGMPFPAVALEARLGGFILPFDFGVKVGFIPDEVDMGQILPAGMGADYRLVGADVRFRIIEERILIPELIIGGGINRLTGGVSFLTEDDIQIANFEVPNPDDLTKTDTYNISLAAPEFGFDWATTVIDFKAQISKRLLIITPYLGLGMTMGRSKVSGGAYTTVQGVTEQEWTKIEQALKAQDQDVPQLTKEGFTITNRQGGFATRIYGGTSLNLFFLKFDVTGFYELLSQSLGISAALRLQF